MVINWKRFDKYVKSGELRRVILEDLTEDLLEEISVISDNYDEYIIKLQKRINNRLINLGFWK